SFFDLLYLFVFMLILDVRYLLPTKWIFKDVKNKFSDIDKLLDQGGVTDDVLLSRLEAMKQLQELNSSVNCIYHNRKRYATLQLWVLWIEGVIGGGRLSIPFKDEFRIHCEDRFNDPARFQLTKKRIRKSRFVSGYVEEGEQFSRWDYLVDVLNAFWVWVPMLAGFSDSQRQSKFGWLKLLFVDGSLYFGCFSFHRVTDLIDALTISHLFYADDADFYWQKCLKRYLKVRGRYWKKHSLSILYAVLDIVILSNSIESGLVIEWRQGLHVTEDFVVVEFLGGVAIFHRMQYMARLVFNLGVVLLRNLKVILEGVFYVIVVEDYSLLVKGGEGAPRILQLLQIAAIILRKKDLIKKWQMGACCLTFYTGTQFNPNILIIANCLVILAGNKRLYNVTIPTVRKESFGLRYNSEKVDKEATKCSEEVTPGEDTSSPDIGYFGISVAF
ncbi:hypothetical protein Tco_0363405, partial [Tanacetum coccineum]